MFKFSLVMVTCATMVMLVGCAKDYGGDYCQKLNTCTSQVGEPIDVSECTKKTNAAIDFAHAFGCGDFVEDYSACLEDASCEDLLKYWKDEEVPVQCAEKDQLIDQCFDSNVEVEVEIDIES